jgi:hypothetical protein
MLLIILETEVVIVRLLNKNDPTRKWRSFKRHAILVFEVVIISLGVTLAWYSLWKRGYHFAEDDKDVVIGAIITTFGVTYGIQVSWIINTIWEKYQKVVICVLKQDKETFLLYRDERMPIMFHLLIAFVSFPLLGMIGAVDYKHAITGMASVFSVCAVLTLFWIIATQLEDPTKGAWFSERIPTDWLTTPIDEHFHLGQWNKNENSKSQKT